MPNRVPEHLTTQPEEPGCSKHLLVAANMHENSASSDDAHACGLPVAFCHHHRSPFETPFTTPPASFNAGGDLAASAATAEQDAPVPDHAHALGDTEIAVAFADVARERASGEDNSAPCGNAGKIKKPPTSEQKVSRGKGGDWSLREMLGGWVRPAAARERSRRSADAVLEGDGVMHASESAQEALVPEMSATPAVFESQMVHLSRHSGETIDDDVIGMHVGENEPGEGAPLVGAARSSALGLGSANFAASPTHVVIAPADDAAVHPAATTAGVSRMSAVAAAARVRAGSAAAAAEAAATLIRAERRMPAGLVRWGRGSPLERELETTMQESGIRVRDVRSGFVARHAYTARGLGDAELVREVRQGLLSAVMDWWWYYG